MIVAITELAWDDLVQIGSSIAHANPARAESFVDDIYDRCRELGHMAHAFSRVPGREQSGIRRRVHGNYLIFYRVGAETVEILRILHGAMDYGPLLFPED